MNSMMISFSGWICSILSTRHKNLVGCWFPPNVPPRCVRFIALSTSVSAVSPKQCSFQYLFFRPVKKKKCQLLIVLADLILCQ